MGIDIRILGTARDLRTDTVVLYAQTTIPDYLAWISRALDAFEVQRKRTWHPSYRRMKADIAAGALLPTITLTVRPELASEMLRQVADGRLEQAAETLARPGAVHILDGLQRSFILMDLQAAGHLFDPQQKLHTEIWLEQNIHHFIYRVLVLNAAHQPMPLRHQFKLIFLMLKHRLETDIAGLKIYRKVPGVCCERHAGMYLFERVVVSLLCYIMQTPEISIDNIEAREAALAEIFTSTADTLGRCFERFAGYMARYRILDEDVWRIYGHAFDGGGETWLAGENVMKAFFAAAARCDGCAVRRRRAAQALDHLSARLVSSPSGGDPLGLQRFEKCQSDIDPRKWNVGYAARAILLAGFLCFLDNAGAKALPECWPPHPQSAFAFLADR